MAVWRDLSFEAAEESWKCLSYHPNLRGQEGGTKHHIGPIPQNQVGFRQQQVLQGLWKEVLGPPVPALLPDGHFPGLPSPWPQEGTQVSGVEQGSICPPLAQARWSLLGPKAAAPHPAMPTTSLQMTQLPR